MPVLMHSGFLCAVAAAALCKVGSLRISNQPNLKTKTMIFSQRLLLFIPYPGCSCHILKSFSPAVKGQNCSFFDKSIKLGRVTNLYKTNIS